VRAIALALFASRSMECRNLRNNYPRPPPAKVSMNFRRGIVFILYTAAAAEGERVYGSLSLSLSLCLVLIKKLASSALFECAVRACLPAVSLFSRRRVAASFFPPVCGEWAACVSLCLLTMQTRPCKFEKASFALTQHKKLTDSEREREPADPS